MTETRPAYALVYLNHAGHEYAPGDQVDLAYGTDEEKVDALHLVHRGVVSWDKPKDEESNIKQGRRNG